MQCLILDNKEVKAAVDELTTVLGSKDAAYYVVSENNGHAIDQAPNGEPSKLFSDLLSHYNGNREQAIKAKVKVFTDEFKSWFGDWINNVEDSSKIVDENGEPLIVYHNGYEDIKVFKGDEYGDIYFGDYMTAATYSGLPTKVFLSIRNPLTIDGKGEEIGDAVEKQYPG
jgi:hypothetical protein